MSNELLPPEGVEQDSAQHINEPALEEDRPQKTQSKTRLLLKQGLFGIISFAKVVTVGVVVWVLPPGIISAILCFSLWLFTKPITAYWYSEAPTVWWRQWQILLVILAILPFIMYAFWRIPKRQVDRLTSKIDRNDYRSLEAKDRVQVVKDLAKLESDARLTLAQMFGGAFILLGLYFTAENLRVTQNSATVSAVNAEANVKVAQDRLVSERFTQAVQQLGKMDQPDANNLAMRLGAIQTLEQLAWIPTIRRVNEQGDSGPTIPVRTGTGTAVGVLTYHEPVMRILATFFRANADEFAYKRAEAKANGAGVNFSWPPADLSEILKVLGRRKLTQEPRSELTQRLDLTFTVMRDARLFRANFEGADLKGADLRGADLRGAVFRDALLFDVKLEGAHVEGANFSGAEGITWEYIQSVANTNDKTIPPTGVTR